VVGVLNDYDLSSTKDIPIGRERTGTVPFMALDLEDKPSKAKWSTCTRMMMSHSSGCLLGSAFGMKMADSGATVGRSMDD